MLALTLALLASAPAAPSPSFVLLNRATYLRLAPTDDATKVRDPRIDVPPAMPILEEDFWVLRFVAKDANGWITVETAPGLVDSPLIASDDGYHCYPGARVSGLALRFYVRAEELQTVLTRAVKHDAADGTGFTLRPGVAVGRPMDERIPVSLDGLRFKAKIPADHVGTTYQPFREQEPALFLDSELPTEIAANTTVSLDGAAVDTTRALAPLLVSSKKPLASGASLVTSGWNCGSFVFQVAPVGTGAVVVRADLGSGTGLGSIRGQAAERPVVIEGAKAWWRNGSPAGRVIFETDLDIERPRVGARRCFAFSLRNDQPQPNQGNVGPLEVCFDPKDVTKSKPMQGLKGLGPGGAK